MSWTLLAPFLCTFVLAGPDYAMHQHLAAQGPQGLAHPGVAWVLRLSPEQQEEIAGVMEDQQLSLASIGMQPGEDEQEAIIRQLERTIAKWRAEYCLLAVLNAEQRERAGNGIGIYLAEQLNSNKKDTAPAAILFYDPLQLERVRRIA